MEFHRLGQEKIKKIFWPGSGPDRALSLCKLNGGSTAEVKEFGWDWEFPTGSGWHGNLVFQIYRARTSSGGAIPPAGCHFYFAPSKWRKWSGSKRISLMMRIHYGCLCVKTRWCSLICVIKREFHGIHGSGTRNWNLDTHEIHGIHDFHGILFHGIPLDCLDFHGIP